MEDVFKEDEVSGSSPEQRARALSKRELPKRFYQKAAFVSVENGYAITLDDRNVKTPGKDILTLPSATLAAAVAAEWEAQEKEINPAKMPLTRLANTAQDAVTIRFDEVAEDIVRFAGNDALCYRAEEPTSLVEAQRQQLDPIVTWAGDLLGGRFVLIEGIIHAPQDDKLLAAFKKQLTTETALRLASLHTITSICGSAIIALALRERQLDPDAAWKAAHIEEDFNIERWGEDAEAAQIRAYKRDEFDAAVLVLNDV